jgi:uncharacterized protein YacL
MNLIILPIILATSILIIAVVIRVVRMPFYRLVFVAIGSIIGLLLGALISIPISNLPSPFGSIMPVVVSLVLTIVVVTAILNQSEYIAEHVPLLKKLSQVSIEGSDAASVQPIEYRVLADTSAIIDGRIADIAKAGFIHATLMVPRFVLAELQNIADSEDAMRRSRGRRGLEVLNQLRAIDRLKVEVSSQDVPEIKEVDAKLIALGKRLGADVLTTDYNLNRVAQIEGVKVLNVNELANAIRPVVLPGEEMTVKVVQPGKEKGQGVGYLDDGTMIVVEQGDGLIGQEVVTEVTRVFQTVAGKMIFAMPKQPVADLNQTDKAPVKKKSKS